MNTIETERLVLRAYTENDFAAVHSYASRVENVRYMPFGPNSEEETRAFISMAIAKAGETPCDNVQYAVTLKSTGALIGGCSLALTGGGAEIGWMLHRDHWRQGYGTEMGKALLTFGFDALCLHRIVARCDAENHASYRVMEKIGMRREGLFLEARPASKGSDQKYGDELFYAILKDEWEAQKGKKRV
ncbi:MAG: GNAT family N-acetyltransferase [Firmicutes bacterium]|nr:GNAT family N-acetyltransferase [Bacillota bacterium]